MRIFLTGGAGFIGSNLARHLVAIGDHDVTVFDALTYAGNRDNLADLIDNGSIRFIVGDIVTERPCRPPWPVTTQSCMLRPRPTSIGRCSDPMSKCGRTATGTNIMCDVAREVGVSRFLHVSTDEV